MVAEIKKAIQAVRDQQYFKELSFRTRPNRLRITIPQAKKMMWECLRELLGERAMWRKEYDDVASWLTDNKGKGLLLLGGVGTGKTFLSVHVIPVLLKIAFPERSFYAYSAYEINEKQKRIMNHETLVILDDIGCERPVNDYGHKYMVFNEIVDRAERLGIILIINSNLTPQEISERYGARTLDRLKGLTKAINFLGGHSFRNYYEQEKK